MRPLSKSKLMAYRQCPKRVWLEVHHPDLRVDTATSEKNFATGHQVGEIAQQLYDPKGQGTVIEPFAEGIDAALALTLTLLDTPQPIFEAGFAAEGAMAFADVLLPVQENVQAHTQTSWRMIEVKSSTAVKATHREDVAVQAFVARAAGVPLTAIALAHIDNTWTYPGGGDYQGLFIEKDLTDEAFARGAEVQRWIEGAQSAVAQATAPAIAIGPHCHDPYACGFYAHCQSQVPQAEHPIALLPGALKKKLGHAHHKQRHYRAQTQALRRPASKNWLRSFHRSLKLCSRSSRAWSTFYRSHASITIIRVSRVVGASKPSYPHFVQT